MTWTKDTMPRHLESKRQGVKELLRDGEWHNQDELIRAGGLRFGGRVHELRHDERLTIECRFIARAGAFMYRWPTESRQLSIGGSVRPIEPEPKGERSDPRWTVGEEGGPDAHKDS
jgi:hypothetical protein